MSEYKGIKGFQVQTRTEDPTPFAQAIANNPYAGAWGSGGSLNTARYGAGAAGADEGARRGGAADGAPAALGGQLGGRQLREDARRLGRDRRLHDQRAVHVAAREHAAALG